MSFFSLFTRSGLLLRCRAAGWTMGVLLGAFLPQTAVAKVDEGLGAVQRAALAHAGLRPQTTTQLLVRQHLAALLPQVRVTLGRGWQLTATGRALDGLTAPEVDNDHTSYAVSASWDLARLLVPHEAMQLQRDEPRRAQLRLALLARVTQLVAARCRLLQREQVGAEQYEQAAELEAALDLLTGGQALPAVSPGSPCPAAPRFDPELTRGAAGGRRVSSVRLRALKGLEDGGGGAAASDGDEFGAAGDPGPEAADVPLYDRR